jgi:hypothetical protein
MTLPKLVPNVPGVTLYLGIYSAKNPPNIFPYLLFTTTNVFFLP